MKTEGIINRMIGLGFRDYGWDNMSKGGRHRIFGRRLANGPKCECNEKIPELLAHVYFYHEIDPSVKLKFDVCGEANGRWLKPMIYSVGIDEIEEALPGILKAMEAMWKAGYEAISENSEGNEVRERIRVFFESIDYNRFLMLEPLWRVYESGEYMKWGFESFSDYVQVEIGLPIRQAQYLVRFGKWYSELDGEIKTNLSRLPFSAVVELFKCSKDYGMVVDKKLSDMIREENWGYYQVFQFSCNKRHEASDCLADRLKKDREKALERLKETMDDGVDKDRLVDWLRMNREIIEEYLEVL